MSHSIHNIIQAREDVPAAAVVGADAESALRGGSLGCLSQAHQRALFANMFQEIIFQGEELFQELDSMSPLFYIVTGCVQVSDSKGVVYKRMGELLAGEVLEIAAGMCLCMSARATCNSSG